MRWESVTRFWESFSCREAASTVGAPAPAMAAATTATATMSRLRTWAVLPRRVEPVASPTAPPSAEVETVFLPVRLGRVFCTGARIPDSCTHLGPG